MNEIKIFKNPEFGSVRTTSINNEPYFVGKDVADILGYQNGSRDINRHVDEEDRYKIMVFDGNQDKETIVINESGLYSLILSSKLPSAKKFKHWVTSEILPSIRKHGGYIVGQEEMSGEELLTKAVIFAKKRIEEMEKQITTMKPKEIFADAVSASETSILIRDLAKLIRQNGCGMGEKRLYKWMRENGYICKGSTQPTQRAMEQGLFENVVRTVQRGDKPPIETITTKVTGKGQVFFVNKFLGN